MHHQCAPQMHVGLAQRRGGGTGFEPLCERAQHQAHCNRSSTLITIYVFLELKQRSRMFYEGARINERQQTQPYSMRNAMGTCTTAHSPGLKLQFISLMASLQYYLPMRKPHLWIVQPTESYLCIESALHLHIHSLVYLNKIKESYN